MPRKLASLLIVLSVTLNVAFVGFWSMRFLRARCASSDHGGVGCPLHRLLGADQAQWQRIEPVVTAFRKEAQAVCAEVTRARLELLELLASPEPDKQKLAAGQEAILAGQRRLQELVIKHLLAEKGLLTPKQTKELFELVRQRSACAGHGPLMELPRALPGAGEACADPGLEPCQRPSTPKEASP